jgi:predicted nuclease of predicted toxin-antitoxin system
LKFKLDENVPVGLLEDLRARGYDSDTVLDENLQGASDAVVVEAARAEGRIVLTLDTGIANPLRHPRESHVGVVLFRLNSVGRKSILSFRRSRLPLLLTYPLANHVTVVNEDQIRFP